MFLLVFSKILYLLPTGIWILDISLSTSNSFKQISSSLMSSVADDFESNPNILKIERGVIHLLAIILLLFNISLYSVYILYLLIYLILSSCLSAWQLSYSFSSFFKAVGDCRLDVGVVLLSSLELFCPFLILLGEMKLYELFYANYFVVYS